MVLKLVSVLAIGLCGEVAERALQWLVVDALAWLLNAWLLDLLINDDVNDN